MTTTYQTIPPLAVNMPDISIPLHSLYDGSFIEYILPYLAELTGISYSTYRRVDREIHINGSVKFCFQYMYDDPQGYSLRYINENDRTYQVILLRHNTQYLAETGMGDMAFASRRLSY